MRRKGRSKRRKKGRSFQILDKPKLPYWVSQDTLSLSKRKRLHFFVGGRQWPNYREEMMVFPVAEKAKGRQVPLKVRSSEEMF